MACSRHETLDLAMRIVSTVLPRMSRDYDELRRLSRGRFTTRLTRCRATVWSAFAERPFSGLRQPGLDRKRAAVLGFVVNQHALAELVAIQDHFHTESAQVFNGD